MLLSIATLFNITKSVYNPITQKSFHRELQLF